MFEHRSQRLLTPRQFFRRQAKFIAVAAVLVIPSLAIGTAGYMVFEHLGLLDAFHAATMILTGMGPAVEVKSDASKIFVSIYALFASLIFLSCGALLAAPLFHRLMHRLHVDLAEEKQDHPPSHPSSRQPEKSDRARRETGPVG